MSGLIKDLRCQHSVTLVQPKQTKGLRWKIDFSYTVVATGKLEFAEAKGFPDQVYLLKLRLFKNDPPGALEIWKGGYKNPKVVERIEPITKGE